MIVTKIFAKRNQACNQMTNPIARLSITWPQSWDEASELCNYYIKCSVCCRHRISRPPLTPLMWYLVLPNKLKQTRVRTKTWNAFCIQVLLNKLPNWTRIYFGNAFAFSIAEHIDCLTGNEYILPCFKFLGRSKKLEHSNLWGPSL